MSSSLLRRTLAATLVTAGSFACYWTYLTVNQERLLFDARRRPPRDLPDGIDAKAMQPRAVHARVAYVPGIAFYADGSGGSHMRLSYCFPPPERIREGVRRLSAVLAHEIELRETFGSTFAEGPVPGGSSRPYGPTPDLT